MIDIQLSHKLEEIPEDVVRDSDLNIYAKKDEVVANLPDNLVYDTDIADVVRTSNLDEVVATLEDEIGKLYHFKGSVANLEELQAIENPHQGDVYNIADTGMNAAWTGEVWDEFGSIADLTPYAKDEDIQPISAETLDRIFYGGKKAVVANIDNLNAMITNDEPEVVIVLDENLAVTSPITIPEGKQVTLDLRGKSITATGNTVPLYANGGELIVKNGAVSANTDAIVVRNGGSVVIEKSDIVSSGSNAISAVESTITVNSGNIQSQEAGLLGFKNSTIVINGGTITGIDNGPVMGNGSAAGSANDGTNMNVIMNGGKLIAHIQSPGYIACGVYIPNSGSFTMNGGEIESDGAGLVMRGGKVTLNGGKIIANGATGVTGKVGDSRVVVGPYAVVYDANSKYPAMNSLELVIGKDMILEGTDGDIQTILADGINSNITDNR